MILDSTKFKKMIKEPQGLLRIFMAGVFISAGLFRIFSPDLAAVELVALNLSPSLSWVLVIFEIGLGTLLLLEKTASRAAYLLFIFLFCAVTYGLTIAGREILKQSWELFLFRLTPTDIFLHIAFMVMLLVIVMLRKDRK